MAPSAKAGYETDLERKRGRRRQNAAEQIADSGQVILTTREHSLGKHKPTGLVAIRNSNGIVV
jgi:hypothetical protein